jgi:hypothetical protein
MKEKQQVVRLVYAQFSLRQLTLNQRAHGLNLACLTLSRFLTKTALLPG